MARLTRIVLIVLLLAAFGAPARAAEKSTGLYAPFPTLTGRQHLERYVADFGVTIPADRLRDGTRVGRSLPAAPPAAVAAAAPAERAHAAPGLLGATILGILGACALVALTIGLIDWRRSAP